MRCRNRAVQGARRLIICQGEKSCVRERARGCHACCPNKREAERAMRSKTERDSHSRGYYISRIHALMRHVSDAAQNASKPCPPHDSQALVEGSSACNCGIVPGDCLMEVNGKNVYCKGIQNATKVDMCVCVYSSGCTCWRWCGCGCGCSCGLGMTYALQRSD